MLHRMSSVSIRRPPKDLEGHFQLSDTDFAVLMSMENLIESLQFHLDFLSFLIAIQAFLALHKYCRHFRIFSKISTNLSIKFHLTFWISLAGSLFGVQSCQRLFVL